MSGLIIDSFAGGGGASVGIKRALGRGPDIAVNHDPEAVGMHAANHPETYHYCQNIWRLDPRDVAQGRKVALAWFSPDCTHFSKAKGGQPVKRHVRDLAWSVILWAERARPAVIILENVEEFRDWGPLITVEGGKLMPCPVRKGFTFKRWVRELTKRGYRVEWRELRACDYGAPTIRKRLFLIARCDGEPIVWPAPTHGLGLRPFRTAAEIIDWRLPCPSIFLTREEGRALGVNRPLAAATMARIARGVRRFVLDNADPFIVPVTHAGDDRVHDVAEPVRTITTANRGELALVAPTLVQTGYGERPGQAPRALDLHKPLGTVVGCGQKHALVSAFLAQHNTGMVGHRAAAPVSTIVGKGCTQAVVASTLLSMKGGGVRGGADLRKPAPTITAGGWHVAEVRAFLVKYYSDGGQDQSAREPLHTVTAKARMGLVTVQGEDFQLADIGMRMLQPRELFSAQGFPADYIIDRMADGAPLTKTAQIRMCGNSVVPDLAEALVRANCAGLARKAAA